MKDLLIKDFFGHKSYGLMKDWSHLIALFAIEDFFLKNTETNDDF